VDDPLAGDGRRRKEKRDGTDGSITLQGAGARWARCGGAAQRRGDTWEAVGWGDADAGPNDTTVYRAILSNKVFDGAPTIAACGIGIGLYHNSSELIELVLCVIRDVNNYLQISRSVD
jgi:hypothetical protein